MISHKICASVFEEAEVHTSNITYHSVGVGGGVGGSGGGGGQGTDLPRHRIMTQNDTKEQHTRENNEQNMRICN